MKRTGLFGFTLVEILVVISIIAVLVSGILFSMQDAGAISRDAERQSDLRTIEAALELYKNRYGRYPEGCNTAGSWSGQQDTDYECGDGGSRYILGDPAADRAFVPDFMSALPTDPRLNSEDSGYVYTINREDAANGVSEGMVYKLVVLNTVETEEVNYTHPFTRCGARSLNANISFGDHECASVPDAPVGGNASVAVICSKNQVANNANDYAVVGGFADGNNDQIREYYSDSIRCK